MKNIAGALIVIGLASISVFAWTHSGGKIGGGWAFMAGLVLFCWGWEKNEDPVETPWQREERRYYSGTKEDDI